MKKGFTGVICYIKEVDGSYRAYDVNTGADMTSDIHRIMRKKAFQQGKNLAEWSVDSKRSQWRITDEKVGSKAAPKAKASKKAKEKKVVEVPVVLTAEQKVHETTKEFIHNKSVGLKPEKLFLEDLKWKYLVRSAVRGKNIMMTGHAGCGKTFAVQSLIKALDRPHFYFNLGATQDPRSTLIGNTHFNPEDGTYFSESTFVKAIQTENAVVLLDELTRAHPDAWNILMTVLDETQRYLRIDEMDNSPVVNVASGVTFCATANVGNEYTSTRVIDRALKDRFVIIEMPLLTSTEEYDLLKLMYPEVDEYSLKSIAEITSTTRDQYKLEDSKLSDMVSTRSAVSMAELIYDGFTLQEAAEVSIYPFFSDDGGTESERTYVKQIVQKFIKDDSSDSQYEGGDTSSNFEYVDVDSL